MRHADETGWRTDGRSGHAWLFASATVSLFLFRATRSAQVPKEVLGTSALSGVLVVDRYSAYNQSPCPLQYCYAHLMSEVEDLAKELPGETEVTAFTSTLIPLLAEAMHLRGRPLADADYYDQARPLQHRSWIWMSNPPNTWGSARFRASSATTPIICNTGWKTVRCRPTTTGPSVNCARR